ncbi:efflux RND transporter periplasmic adaptor subunit [Chryseobacterium koreense]|uniref:Cation transporter n=1 Tax=Chryseobacterium koreense CCUG 49689 TaxID=1304281 RepID=A0A0J7IXS5_9FLAO|nr:efflux RND transporter periplasmic adaptor subunit [Chryseobacterium koreense]KMQ70621.1 cation transporter [Chryseobacterium koreense CCUG 49689]MBB5334584.1 cobalt-zinc-cadmium efflux system membrane fusion protein [Chryseobacterium koreense]
MKTKYIICTSYLAASLLLSCSPGNKNEGLETKKYCISQDLKKDTRITAVSMQPIEESITLTGEVESNSDKTVPYVSMVDGVVADTFFSLGDYVKQGQILATVKSASVNEMQDDSQTLQAQLAVAKRKLSAVQSMYKDDIASQKDLEEARAEVNILQSNISKTRKNMQVYSAGQSTIQIKAPASGYVIEKNISKGMPVAAGGEQLFVVSNLDKVWVMANVYATNMRHIYVNQPAAVKTLAYPDERFSGRINAVSQVFNENERVLKAKIIMDNNNMKLRPGMSADIELPIKTKDLLAIAVPTKSLIFDNNQNYVIVYKNDCDMQIRMVNEISTNNNTSYIEGDIKAGEKIISTNALLIYENLKSNITQNKK